MTTVLFAALLAAQPVSLPGTECEARMMVLTEAEPIREKHPFVANGVL